jgi:hypothetical protein
MPKDYIHPQFTTDNPDIQKFKNNQNTKRVIFSFLQGIVPHAGSSYLKKNIRINFFY